MLLDSAARGRAVPDVRCWRRCRAAALWLDAGGAVHVAGDLPQPSQRSGFLAKLDAQWRQRPQAPRPRTRHLPFGGGWFVYLGYELALEIEPALRRFWPAASFARCAARGGGAARAGSAAAGRAPATATLVAEPSVSAGERAGRSWTTCAAARTAAARSAGKHRHHSGWKNRRGLPATRRALPSNTSATAISTRPTCRGPGAPSCPRLSPPQRCTSVCAAPIPRRLPPSRSSGRFCVLSSSPERLLRMQGRRLDTRPIAGTRYPRGQTAATRISSWRQRWSPIRRSAPST